MKKIVVASVLLMSVIGLSGCASSMSGGAYSRDQTGQAQTVEMGVVDSVREVRIEGTKTPIGAGTGAVLGGLAGSNMGSGSGNTAGAVFGAVVGGLAGAAVEEGVTKKAGFEITVRLDSGRMLAVVQETDEQFHPGDRVRVLTGNGVTRVSH